MGYNELIRNEIYRVTENRGWLLEKMLNSTADGSTVHVLEGKINAGKTFKCETTGGFKARKFWKTINPKNQVKF